MSPCDNEPPNGSHHEREGHDVADNDELRAGLSPYETAVRLRRWIISGNSYARTYKQRFRLAASLVKTLSLGLLAASTVILGLQDLEFWSGLGFSLVALVTVINAVEPFFNWRSRWVLMEEAQYRFYRLQDDLDYLLAKTAPTAIRSEDLDPLFERYQDAWENLSRRWLEHRRAAEAGAASS
jgi:hypothetical protein